MRLNCAKTKIVNRLWSTIHVSCARGVSISLILSPQSGIENSGVTKNLSGQIILDHVCDLNNVLNCLYPNLDTGKM